MNEPRKLSQIVSGGGRNEKRDPNRYPLSYVIGTAGFEPASDLLPFVKVAPTATHALATLHAQGYGLFTP